VEILGDAVRKRKTQNLEAMEKKVMPNVKLYRRHINIFWWANRWIHIKFIARELTSICVGVYSLIFLFFIWTVLQGPETFEAFSSAMRSPAALVFHLFLLGGILFHGITWFNLAPKAMVIKRGDKTVPGTVIALMNYLGWMVISVALIWLLLAV
jgi:fumarate reductase subunit C